MTVIAINCLDENILRIVIGNFLEHLRERGWSSPIRQTATPSITTPSGTPDVRRHPSDLDDVLFFVRIHGDNRGQDRIEREAKFRKRGLDLHLEGVSAGDFGMSAWRHDWPRNPDQLEAAYARSRTFGNSAYVYSPMLRDLRRRFREPTQQRLVDAQLRLEDSFANREGLGKGTNIVPYDYPKEIWILVRYPGQTERTRRVTSAGIRLIRLLPRFTT